MTASAAAPDDPNAAIEHLTDQIFRSGIAAMELANVYLGHTLGLYHALAAGGHTSATLAATAHCDERYVREWLQSQVVSGYVTTNGTDLTVATCTLAPGAREVLVDEVSPVYLAPLGQCLAAVGAVLPDLVRAFRSGDGVPYERYGPDAVAAQGALNRPAYANDLAAAWLPALPDVATRLADRTRPSAVADIGCGVGWAAIELAKAYPHLLVDGYDADTASIATARHNAAKHDVADRVTFALIDTDSPDPKASYAIRAPYEFVTMLEVLHDLGDPDGVLSTVRTHMAPGATLLVMEERTDDELTGPSPDLAQRYFANVSPLWCLPQGRVGAGAHPVGTVIRAETVRRLLSGAGFTDIADVAIEHPFFRFTRATA